MELINFYEIIDENFNQFLLLPFNHFVNKNISINDGLMVNICYSYTFFFRSKNNVCL